VVAATLHQIAASLTRDRQWVSLIVMAADIECFALSASYRSRVASWRYFSALVERMMNINAAEQF